MTGFNIDVTGTVTHTVSHSGKITYGSATKGGEIYFTFDPGAPFEEQTKRAENAIRLLERAKYLYANPENLPKLGEDRMVSIQSGGAGAKVGGKS